MMDTVSTFVEDDDDDDDDATETYYYSSERGRERERTEKGGGKIGEARKRARLPLGATRHNKRFILPRNYCDGKWRK